MAFQFPNSPQPNETKTNDITGVTYQWRDDLNKWVVTSSNYGGTDQLLEEVSQNTASITKLESDLETESDKRDTGDKANLGLIKANADDIEVNTADINALKQKPDAVTYQIGTDKVMRSGEPAIELVDSESNFSNVKFRGLGGVQVTSDLQSIIIDGSSIQATGDYYTKDEVDQQISDRGVGYEYVLSSLNGTIQIRPGEFGLDNRKAGYVQMLSYAPEDEGGKTSRSGESGDIIILKNIETQKEYRYVVTTGGDRAYTVTYDGADVDKEDTFEIGKYFLIYVYPTGSNFVRLTGPVQTIHGDIKYDGSTQSYNNLVNREYVDNAIASVQQLIVDASAEVDQNEEQLQALSTNFMQTVLNVQTLVQEIQELKTRLQTLEDV